MSTAYKDSTNRSVSVRGSNGRFAKGNKPTNGFDKRPEDRSHGCWNKSSTPRGKLEKMMTFTEDELLVVSNDNNAPMFERRIANIILDATWAVLRDMIDQVYGKPKESVDIKDKSENDPIIKGFVIPTLPSDFIKIDEDHLS
ncbi:MAG TPA: hypothetical protein PKD19_01835 [Candidatus Saccharibacteria bacterium]|nr:hypothetical protein [Candidatus Saccharibacteria bacterium]HMR38357.1 hypothetical protein [Candidatus Saccharibacteria bacterium]